MQSIEDAIKQPVFKSSLHRATVNIVYTSAWLNQSTSQILRPLGLSLQQFNILRILRGRAGKPATVKLLTERMLDKMSNASRLVDKLKEKGLVERQECPTDRRQVDIVITQAGLDLIQRASEAVEKKQANILQRITEAEANQLSYLLDKLRG
ncbi:MarR family transcriptional regulator [Neolewinella aurantiaca]|uniref:MarR family transcriptional regulator n=1 Tax=Neolewinella aurantiaca TaxID=2602767 RepID=A0A5C7FRU1_9BACT|nr:MarR family transcriptional regulator [Neolewinella aurantiaca]TXF89079.1 MarR family transcriptional regulator [Neolewinella aurantiaca]